MATGQRNNFEKTSYYPSDVESNYSEEEEVGFFVFQLSNSWVNSRGRTWLAPKQVPKQLQQQIEQTEWEELLVSLNQLASEHFTFFSSLLSGLLMTLFLPVSILLFIQEDQEGEGEFRSLIPWFYSLTSLTIILCCYLWDSCQERKFVRAVGNLCLDRTAHFADQRLSFTSIKIQTCGQFTRWRIGIRYLKMSLQTGTNWSSLRDSKDSLIPTEGSSVELVELPSPRGNSSEEEEPEFV